MNKAVKKLRKLKDHFDKLEEKEDDLLHQIDEAIDALEEDEDEPLNYDVESGSDCVFVVSGSFGSCVGSLVLSTSITSSGVILIIFRLLFNSSAIS